MNNYKKTEKPKLQSQDWGWICINIGMGIGAGIVFLPVEAGIVGVWTFLFAVLIAYPGLYLFQRLFINTLVEAEISEEYPAVISHYLGKNWGALLGAIYFFMLLIWLFVYSETITNDSASYIHTAGLTEGLLSGNPLYSLGILVFLVILAFISRKLLLNISKLLVVLILSVLIILSLLIIPSWSINNIMGISSFGEMVQNIIITLPFAMTSILFLQSLSPMVISVRSRSEAIKIARERALKIMNTSFFILAFIVFFFALSCTMAVDHSEALQAFNNNTSSLALIAKVIPGVTVPLMGIVLDIAAIVTSFFGVLLGFHEASMGLFMNIFFRKKKREEIDMKKLSFGVIIFTILVAWCAAIINFPILYFTSISSPVFAIIGCFIPVLLVYNTENLRKYRGLFSYLVIITGILLLISPILTLISPFN